MNEKLEKEGLSLDAVTDWNGRPKRQRKPPPPTYWEEYVVTDDWYLRELTADVPESEMRAALEDEDWDGEDGGEEDEEIEELSGEEEDPSYSEAESESDEDDGSSSSSEGEELSDESDVLSETATDDDVSGGDGRFTTPEEFVRRERPQGVYYTPRSPSYSPPATPTSEGQ